MDQKTLGFIGSGLLAVGVFSPIVAVPISGNMNYFDNGRADGILVLASAAVAAGLLFTDRLKPVTYAGIAAAVVLAYSFFNFQVRLWQMKEEMADSLLGGLALVALQSIRLQWGCAVLVAGAGCLIAVGLRKNAARSSLKQF